MIIRSLYRESNKDQFELEVIREDNENYWVRLLPEYREEFQEKGNITKLPKRMVDNKELYEIKKIKYEQLNLFNL